MLEINWSGGFLPKWIMRITQLKLQILLRNIIESDTILALIEEMAKKLREIVEARKLKRTV